jgi:hypothetical protein
MSVPFGMKYNRINNKTIEIKERISQVQREGLNQILNITIS